MKVVFGNSDTGRVDEIDVAGDSVQLTHGTLRSEEGAELAFYSVGRGVWRRQNGVSMEEWTDVTIWANNAL